MRPESVERIEEAICPLQEGAESAIIFLAAKGRRRGGKMKHLGKRILALMLVGALLLTASGTAFAREREVPSVRIYADGLLTGRGFRSGEVVYLSVADVCAFLGLDAEEQYDRTNHQVHVEAEGLSLSAEAGVNYMEVNNRYLLLLKGILIVEGRPYFPVELIEKIFNLRAEISPEKDRVELNLREAKLLRGGEHYYEDTYGSESLLWLSRLINAEAGGQPFVGMVGVGNVVLNRVASDRFPNTVFDVIFDTHNGVQFAPVYDGSIYENASRLSVIAACVSLEGYKTVGDSLFFIAPAIADDSWLREYYVFVTSIGGHDFYM